MKLEYTEEFKKEVLLALPEMEDLEEKLNNGDEIIGRYLDDNKRSFTYSEILYTNLSDLVKQAYKSKKIFDLYSQWYEFLKIE